MISTRPAVLTLAFASEQGLKENPGVQNITFTAD